MAIGEEDGTREGLSIDDSLVEGSLVEGSLVLVKSDPVECCSWLLESTGEELPSSEESSVDRWGE